MCNNLCAKIRIKFAVWLYQTAPHDILHDVYPENQGHIKNCLSAHTHFPQIVSAASRSRMLMTLGRWTFTSYLGKTKAKETKLKKLYIFQGKINTDQTHHIGRCETWFYFLGCDCSRPYSLMSKRWDICSPLSVEAMILYVPCTASGIMGWERSRMPLTMDLSNHWAMRFELGSYKQ